MTGQPAAPLASASARLRAYIPDWTYSSEWFSWARAALGSDLDLAASATSELEKQFFVVTATWSLSDWELRLGLPVQDLWTDVQRRERLLAQMRARGETTLGRVKFVAQAFYGGEIDVIEDWGTYTIIIKFVSQSGIPGNLPSFQNAMRETIPAHLDITYLFSFFIWNQLDAHNYIWSAVDALALTWDQWDSLS